jgi:DNA polymerase
MIYLSQIHVYVDPPGNSDPTSAEKEKCRPLLLQQLKIINPKILVGLGKHASNSILKIANPNHYDLPLEALRNKNSRTLTIQQINLAVNFISTFHPAAWSYSLPRKEKAYQDWDLIKSLLV